MTDVQIVQIGMQAMTISAKLCAPVLITSLVVGFAISLFQSVTQIQEATLSSAFTTQLFEKLPQLLGTA